MRLRQYIYVIVTLSLSGMVQALAQPSSSVENKPVADTTVLEIRADSLSLAGIDGKEVQYADQFTDEYLDTVNVKRKLLVNDYSILGITGGLGMARMSFNPPKSQAMLVVPYFYGITYTKYCKMFGYMPYFGIKLGGYLTQGGYKFKKNKDGEYVETVDGAIKAVYDMVEVDALANFHLDVWHLKFLVDAGLYGGYRLKVHREGVKELGFDSAYADKFHSYDKRFDYGVKAGAGIGVFFDPIEVHIMAHYMYGLSSLYEPDYNSKYYYRFATDSNIQITLGLYIQLGHRTGRTHRQLKEAAKETVWPTMQPESK